MRLDKAMIERWEKAEADHRSGSYTVRHFRTQVYIPVAFIDKKIEEHKAFVDQTGIKVRREYTRDEMRAMIKEDLDKFWVHRIGRKEYSIYENFVTGETRKRVH